MFGSSPGTMGLLCDPRHPALALFPTASHSERQWSRIAHASTPVILTEAPEGLRPIVQVIDNLARNEKIGLVFEGRVGDRGKLLVCAADLYSLQQYSEARQLLASLLHYAASEEFRPNVSLPIETLNRLLRPSLAESRPTTASSSHHPPWGAVPKPEDVVDGDTNTRWMSKEGDAEPWLVIDLGKKTAIRGVQILWDNETVEPYVVEGSNDGKSWNVIADESKAAFPTSRHTLSLTTTVPNEWQHVRVKTQPATSAKPPQVAIRDIRVWGE